MEKEVFSNFAGGKSEYPLKNMNTESPKNSEIKIKKKIFIILVSKINPCI